VLVNAANAACLVTIPSGC